jgi:hypothetical protein
MARRHALVAALLAAAVLLAAPAAAAAAANTTAAAAPAKNAAPAKPVVAPVAAPAKNAAAAAPAKNAAAAAPAKNAAAAAPAKNAAAAAPAKNAAAAAPAKPVAAAPAKPAVNAPAKPAVNAPAKPAAAAAPAKPAAAAAPAKPAVNKPAVVAAAPKVAIDCHAVVKAAMSACSAELRRLDAGLRLNSASRACCSAAATIFNSEFATACSCNEHVAGWTREFARARTAARAQCPAMRTSSVAVPACAKPAAARNAAASLLGDAPATGTGSVCDAENSDTSCVTKCTSSTRASTVRRTEACATSGRSFLKGHCDVESVGDATGLSVCGKGASVPDPREGGARTCFECCTVRLPIAGEETVGKNACPRPRRGRGGGSGGGGGCFPGSATVVVEGKGRVALRDVGVGDRVLSVSRDGKRASFEDVYFFAHKLAAPAASEFVRLETDGGASLELTLKHLIPVLAGKGEEEEAPLPAATYKRAQDVRAGDRVLLLSSETTPTVAHITATSSVSRADGLYAPLTTGGGHVVVDGVVASVHSDWILDPLFEAFGAVDKLHAAYENTHGAAARLAYRVLGREITARAVPLVTAVANGEPAAAAVAVRALVAGGAVAQTVKTA